LVEGQVAPITYPDGITTPRTGIGLYLDFVLYCRYCSHINTWSKNYISIQDVFATKML